MLLVLGGRESNTGLFVRTYEQQVTWANNSASSENLILKIQVMINSTKTYE